MPPFNQPEADEQPETLAAAEQQEARETMTRTKMQEVAAAQAYLANCRTLDARTSGNEKAEERHAEAAERFLTLYLDLSLSPTDYAESVSGLFCGCDDSAMWGE